jgi:hypothetical protein
MTNKLPIKAFLTIIEVTDPQPISGKPYSKMSIKAISDLDESAETVFVTYRPSIFEVMSKSIGKAIECDVLLGEKKIVGVRDDRESLDRDATNRTQTVIRAVADMTLSETVKIPENIMSNHWKLIEKWQSEALK